MMQLFLEPVDVWLFRDGRSFDALSDHRAESLFPPHPSVIQGAIRSYHLTVAGVDLSDPDAVIAEIGTATDVGRLRLRGPFVARREHGGFARYFPQPADAVTVDAERHTLRPASAPVAPAAGTLTSAPTPKLLGLGDPPGKGERGLWLREDALDAYLRGNEVAGVPGDSLFEREERTSVALQRERRTTCEGAIFEVEFVRPREGVGLLVEVAGYEGWPRAGFLRLGGEARGAAFEQVAAPAWPARPDPLPQRFKVFFATPAFFANGWAPAGWSAFFDGPVRLVASATGRHESVGGFDLAAGAHKPARRYLPAGSVYYFECDGSARPRPDLVQQAVTDSGAEIGYGQIRIEAW